MCGIVGFIGTSKAKPILIDGLKRLEYRGYDSAGFALMQKGASDFLVRRSVGQVQALEDMSLGVGDQELQGIAHTRWATHGVPNEVNAHPHRAGCIVLVHNGIIENHSEIKRKLISQGIEFVSQTDTEVFAKLIEFNREAATKKVAANFFELSTEKRVAIVLQAIQKSMTEVQGHYAILLMVQSLDGRIFGVQNGAPLAITQGANGMHLASDLQPLIVFSKKISFIPLGTIFQAEQNIFHYYDHKTLKEIQPQFEVIDWNPEQVAKDGYEHFMLKEIFQQPLVTADTLSGRLPARKEDLFIWDKPEAHARLWKDAKKLYLVACGTAYHAAMVAKYYFERWARLPVEVDVASEFRYRNPVFEAGTIVGVISQSGETADTLSALRLANAAGVPTFSICNVTGSTISRESGHLYPTKAGPEVGVASTKAFTTQLAVLCLLSLDAARAKNLNQGDCAVATKALARLPHDMEILLKSSQAIMELGAKLENKKTILFVGRGIMCPIALEGALKLKEITYRHAEGYPAGELKHGPIALVDSSLAAIVLAPPDELKIKTLSNLEEIKSRGGSIIGVGQEGDEEFSRLCDHYIEIPKSEVSMSPMLYVIALQLMSYGLAKQLKCNIDKPRNLAKSVTVE